MAELKASPQEPITGALAKALEFMAHPTVDGQEIKPRGFNFANLLPLESGAEFFKNRSYGKPLTTGAGGLGGTQNLAPDVRDFALDVAPYAPDLANVAGKGAKAVGKMAGEELNKRFLSGQMFPYGAPTANFVVKPKGGNWLKGSIERQLEELKESDLLKNKQYFHGPEFEKAREARIKELKELGNEGALRVAKHLEDSRESGKAKGAINQWIDKNLTNYIKNQMGTIDDPVRKLADQGILHYEPQGGEITAMSQRKLQGLDENPVSQTPLGKAWENKSDASIVGASYENHLPFGLRQDKALEALGGEFAVKNPQAQAYGINSAFSPRSLGFDHIIDILKQDLAEGRISPDKLKNVSMEQAVRRTHEYNEEMAKKAAETQIKMTEGMPVHKEYPTGHKWIELKAPEKNENLLTELDKRIIAQRENDNPVPQDLMDKTLKQRAEEKLAEALKYEGDTMGHCVGGYCPEVLEGKSRIFSLRDAKGEPHVTVEATPTNRELNPDYAKVKYPDLYAQYRMNPNKYFNSWENYVKQEAPFLLDNPTLNITQIKGKGNAKPADKYLPFVQDFVKSGNWADVGDLHNTGLHDTVMTGAQDIGKASGFDLPRFMPTEDYETVMPLIHKYNNLKQIHGENAPIDEELKSYLPKDTQAPVDLGTVSGAPDATPQFKRGGKVHISDNPDAMMMELSDRKFAGGGAIAKMLERAAPKTISEIRAIAERMAPQVTGEVSGVAGKSNKQFMREKSLPVDIRVDTPMPDPEMVDLAKHKGKVMIGIKGDPTVTNQTLHKVGDIELESPSPQHGGPLYGQGKDIFWASGLGPAQGVQNLAKEASQAYNAPVLGNYVMMGPDSYYYAQHLADANLNAIAKSGMTPEQIEKLNELIRKGGPLSKGPRPNFETVEDIGNAYMQMQMDPKLRKHFNQLMMKPTLSEEIGIPRGQDIAHAITEPSLRNLEIGVTGKSIGEMRPDQPLDYSSHPTYSHDIPGSFLGTSPYPVPYELSFPDTVKAVRANPKQAPQEFGSLKMIGPRQIIDQQMIDEIGQYQDAMKSLTGKKKGGKVNVSNDPDMMRHELKTRG